MTDFPQCHGDDELIICDITIFELLSGMNTTFTAYGWLTSADTHVYLEYSVKDPLSRQNCAESFQVLGRMYQKNLFLRDPGNM